MSINTIYDYQKVRESGLGFSISKLTEKLLDESMKYHNISIPVSVSLLLCSNYKIRKINKQYRNIDKVTDVLSFPSMEFTKPAYFNYKNIEKYIDMDTKELFLGDIVISIDKCFSQSNKYNHSLKREFSFLFIHSILHLLGYDHMDEDAMKRQMRRREKVIMGEAI